MRRNRRRERPHDWQWHEEQLAQPWASFAVFNEDGNTVGTLSEKRWRTGLEGKRQQMAAHDAQPQRVRELVAEHNVQRGLELYRSELLAAPKCRHGRYAASCAQCAWADRPTVTGRDGAALTRQGRRGTGEALERIRQRRDDDAG
jgi:hypothetical protein